jgi:hypothetical protein
MNSDNGGGGNTAVYRAIADRREYVHYWDDGKIRSGGKKYHDKTLLYFITFEILEQREGVAIVQVLPHKAFTFLYRGHGGSIVKTRYEENVLTGAWYKLATDNIEQVKE